MTIAANVEYHAVGSRGEMETFAFCVNDDRTYERILAGTPFRWTLFIQMRRTKARSIATASYLTWNRLRSAGHELRLGVLPDVAGRKLDCCPYTIHASIDAQIDITGGVDAGLNDSRCGPLTLCSSSNGESRPIKGALFMRVNRNPAVNAPSLMDRGAGA